MRIVRLADLMAHKYKVAVSTADLEVMVRKHIDTLYNYVHVAYSVLENCAMADASKPTNEHEALAVAGHDFCKALVSGIDYLRKERNKIPLPKLQKALVDMAKLIDDNLAVKGDVQFPQISALIWEMLPMSGQKVKPAFVDKTRKEMSNKARHGISRIKSVITQALNDLGKMGMTSDTGTSGRFDAQRTTLDVYEIINFIRRHGGEYGIQDEGDWELVFRNDPQFLQDMTTVINAKQRAHTAVEDEQVKAAIFKALKEHRARTEGVNTPYFEAGEDKAKEMALPEEPEKELPPAKEITSSLHFEGLLRKYQ
jgi:hypothetical protein